MLSPIVLFVYNRLEHTKKTVEALGKNDLAKESELFIFSDGPLLRQGYEGQAKKVKEVRDFLKTITGFKNLTIIERDKNLGLANSIISGVTEIINKFGKVIVLEDDLATSPYFLKYMNEALNLYENDDKVISVHGYVYPIKEKLPETFFLRGADCWGWATWKRGWDLFEPDGQKLLNELRERNLAQEFNFNNTQSYLSMLKNQIAGENDSWAVRWYASAFLKEKLTLYPGRSLVKNIGLDSSGFHSGATAKFDSRLSSAPIKVEKIAITKNSDARKEFEKFFNSLKPNLFSKVKRKLAKIINNKFRNKYGFKGEYASWEDAKKHSSGYDSEEIINKVSKAALKVAKKEAAYERDGLIFDKTEYSWHLLAILLWTAAKNDNSLNLMDFGGGLGTSYFQNIDFLGHLKNLRWNIVEQEKFVQYGKENIENEHLKFFGTADECLKTKPDLVILSSSLQYIEKPYELLEKIVASRPPYIVFDKTPFSDSGKDIITVQRVPSHIYDASYPAWVFDISKFLSFFKNNDYKLTTDFNHHRENTFKVKNKAADWMGFLFESK